MKPIGVVYIIENKVNAKVYIGITKCRLQKRWNEHMHYSKNDKKPRHLYSSVKKHGIHNFTIRVLKTCYSDFQLYSSEIYFISFYKSTNHEFGYNNSTGGEASNKGMRHSEQTRKKLSEIQKGKQRKPHSEETKKKLSIAHRLLHDNKPKIDKPKKVRKVYVPKIKRAGIKNNKKPVILNKIDIYESISEGSLQTGISITAINNQLKGRSKSTKAGIWAYHHKN